MIPQVLRDFQVRIQCEIPLTKDIVLNGCETDLESLLVNRRVNEHNYLRILEGILFVFLTLKIFSLLSLISINPCKDRNRMVANAATRGVSMLEVVFCGHRTAKNRHLRERGRLPRLHNEV